MIWLVVVLFVALSVICFYGMHRAMTHESCPGGSLTDAIVAMFFLTGAMAFGFFALVITIITIMTACI